jgi:ATP-dependent 26S proteasome regulatory subunit
LSGDPSEAELRAILTLADYSAEEKKNDETKECDFDLAIEEVENSFKSKKEKEEKDVQ